MKLLLLVLSAAIFTTGCSQPKNRLTDDKNTEFQEKQARANKGNPNPQTILIDVPTPEGVQQVPIQATVQTNEQNVKNETDNNDQELEERVVPERSELVVEEKIDTAASRDQAVADIAKAAGVPETETTTETAAETASETGNAQTNSVPNEVYKLSLNEARSILAQVFQLINDRNGAFQAIKSYNTKESGLSFDKLSLDLDIKLENSNIGILHDGQLIAKFENINFKFGAPVILPSNNSDLVLLSVCANKECDTLMFTIRKATDKDLLFNLPVFLKVVDGKLTRAALKADEEYEKDAKEEAAAASDSKPQSEQPEQNQQATQQVQVPQPLSLTEYTSVLEQISRTQVVKSDEELKQIITFYASPGLKMDINKFGTILSRKKDGLILSIGYDNKFVTGASKIQLKFGEAFKTQTTEGYNFNAVCSNEKCEVIFAVFTKVENNKIVINVPIYYRVLDGQIVRVNVKTDAEYDADTREILKKENNK